MRIRKIVFILALGAVACTPDASPARQETGMPASSSPATSVTVECEATVGGEQVPPAGFEIIGGAVALPTSRDRSNALQVGEVKLPDGKTGLFAKQGLLVRRGELVELIVPENLRGRFWMKWGRPEPLGDQVIVDRCDADKEWLAFAGGYTVRRAACLPVDVRVGNGELRQVHIGIGAPCPGQQPAPEADSGSG
ncbi:hypothetical protein [Streptosporangium sp. NPDC050280]|uniref:hypothetical protein n=1 Tax=unclassified Streptosporangium TaxID=2632669 RepID=UPI00343DA819